MKIAGLIIRTIASKVFLLWILGGWVVYYVFSAIWMEEAFGIFAAGLGNNPFIQFPFMLFLLSGYLNLLRAAKDVIGKGVIQFAAWFIMPLGTLVFFTGFFLSLFLRESGQRIIGEGDIIKPPWVSDSLNVTVIEPGLRESLLDTELERGLFSHQPEMTIVDKLSNSFQVGVFPPKRIDDTYYHILNFGMAPGIKFYKKGKVEYAGYNPLNILMPYSSDFFEIKPYPFRFLVSVKPEKTLLRDDVISSEFNLKKPVYNVRVFNGENIIAEGNSREGVRFDDFTLHFSGQTYWVMLEAVKDPGMPVLRIGILLIAVGFPLWLGRQGYRIWKREYRIY